MDRSNRLLRAAAAATLLMAAATTIAWPLSAPAGARVRPVNLVQEGQFEDVRVPAGDFAKLFEPGDHIGAWTISGATVGVSTPFPPIVTGISGRKLQFLSLKDPTASPTVPVGTVCQRIDVDPAVSYRLRFYSAAATSDITLIVRWQGHVVDRIDEPGSLGDTDWQRRTVALGPATGSTGKLCFSGTGDGYPLLDAVELFAKAA